MLSSPEKADQPKLAKADDLSRKQLSYSSCNLTTQLSPQGIPVRCVAAGLARSCPSSAAEEGGYPPPLTPAMAVLGCLGQLLGPGQQGAGVVQLKD